MGFVGGLLGIGGNKGSNFKAQAAPILQGVNTQQTGQSYFDTQAALAQQQALISALQGQQGIQNQSNVFNQQQDLANQIQGVANGTGPNPALQQLQNTTGQNIANQAALMAGQRGSGANAGLLARQAAQQGGALQQQAVGQGAAMQAQQQLAAMQALQGQQGMMGQLAGQQVGQLQQGTGFLNQAAQGEQGNLLGALGNYNQAQVGSTGSQNSANSAIAAQTQKGQQGLFGGALGGLGAVAGTMFGVPGLGAAVGSALGKAHGGMIEEGPASNAGRYFKNLAHGGILNAKKGAVVPGEAKVKGDDYKNDTVPAMLSPKEIVLPRSVTLAQDAPEKAKAFVIEQLRKRGKK